MRIFKLLLSLSILFSFAIANTLQFKELNDQNISITKGSFKIIEFTKMIKNIKVSDEETLSIDFVEDDLKPLQGIKLFAKNIGHGNLLITFIDSSSIHIDVSIVENMSTVLAVAKSISPNLSIKQTGGKMILEGSVKDQKQKDKIVNLFSKAGIDKDKDLVDLITLENPNKMIRLKLYAVEITNSDGLDLTHNWVVSSKNYTEQTTTDGRYYNDSINDVSTSNAQRSSLINSTIDNMLANAVTLSGGLTSAANYLGKYFNTALALNYLSSEGVANVLDETTLLTLENQDATFHAGGTIYLKIATTTSQGVPTTEVRNINYGLQLDIKAENIVNEEFINLNITTKSTGIDWTNTVDDIPSFTEKSIKTNVVVGNQSTIILGGLISSSNSKDISKIPLLGDIPILGHLFTSKSFKEGKSELVFFITPEIVDPKKNSQLDLFNKKTNFTTEMKINKKDDENKDEKPQEQKVETKSEELTHEQRVRQILGY